MSRSQRVDTLVSSHRLSVDLKRWMVPNDIVSPMVEEFINPLVPEEGMKSQMVTGFSMNYPMAFQNGEIGNLLIGVHEPISPLPLPAVVIEANKEAARRAAARKRKRKSRSKKKDLSDLPPMDYGQSRIRTLNLDDHDDLRVIEMLLYGKIETEKLNQKP